jgi:hypothetical protein
MWRRSADFAGGAADWRGAIVWADAEAPGEQKFRCSTALSATTPATRPVTINDKWPVYWRFRDECRS